MSKKLALILVVFLLVGLLAGCTGSDKGDLKDGKYFAQEEAYGGSWKYAVQFEVKNGKIDMVNYTGIAKKGGTDKKTRSLDGQYPMVERGGAQAPWHEQAQKLEAYLIENQGRGDIAFDEEGKTDAIAGVSVTSEPLFTLVDQALAAGPVDMGAYKDGGYHAEEAVFTNGWKGTVDVTVLNGNIVSIYWSAAPEAGEDDKYTASTNGNYPMVEKGNAQAPWHEQADKVVAQVLASQDLTPVNYIDEDGKTDAIAGVSIGVKPFYVLLEEAMKAAK